MAPDIMDNTQEPVNASLQSQSSVMLQLGTRLVQGLRKSNKISFRLNAQVNRIAVSKAAIAKNGDLVEEAITKELQSMLDKKVLEFVLRSKLDKKQLSSVI